VDRLCGLVVRVPGYRSRGSGFDSWSYKTFWDVVSLERGPLSLVSTIEEKHGRKSSGSGLENQEYGRRDLSRWPRENLYPQKLVLSLPTSGGRSAGIVRSQTQATEFSFLREHHWCVSTVARNVGANLNSCSSNTRKKSLPIFKTSPKSRPFIVDTLHCIEG
jgi:hypothetical protein